MIRFFAAHPTAAFLLALGLVVSGLMALPGLQRDTFPDFLADRVEISAAYPGANAAEVEETICVAIEDALDAVSGIDQLHCTARANVGIARIEVAFGHDVSRLLTDVKTQIDAIATFPDTVEDPIVRQLDVSKPLVSIAVSGTMSETALKSLAEDMRARILRIPGIAEVSISGFSDRRFDIALNSIDLERYGLTAGMIAQAIRRQNIELPAGTIETSERNIALRVGARSRSVSELERMVVRETAAGGAIRLGDIATITENFVEPEIRSLFNGQRAAVLNLLRNSEADALNVFAEVEYFIETERLRLPATASLSLTNDMTSVISERLGLLTINALQGFGLVCLVLWAFFSLRFSLMVALALPLSLLGAVFLMSVVGYDLNLLTTVGLLIAIGLLIDSAVVINENIARHASAGLNIIEAANRGVKEVSGAVLASFLTSVAIFAPLAFLEGDIGRVLRVMPVVLLIVLSVSLVVSFLVLPFFTARALDTAAPHPIRQRLDAAFDAFRDRVVGNIVRLAVSWRYLTLGLTGLCFLAAISLLAGGTLKFQAFPDLEGDIIEARLMMTPGTPLHRTEETVAKIIAALERTDDALGAGGYTIVRNIAVDFSRNANFSDRGPHLATIKADLVPSEDRTARVNEILQLWRQDVGVLTDIVSLTFSEPAIGPAGRPIEIRLAGNDLDQLQTAGIALSDLITGYIGVSDVTTDLHRGTPEIQLTLRDGAGRLGLDATSIATQLRAGLYGLTADEVRIGSETVRIDVRHSADWRADLGQIDDFGLLTDDGRRVPLSAVAYISYSRDMALIPRVDGMRTVTISGDIDPAIVNANELITLVVDQFSPVLSERFPDITMTLAGQAQSQAETAGSMQRVFVIGLIAMFMILSFQFRSYVEPLIVMLSIPLALTGVLVGHWLMGLDMSMPSVVGFVSLAGIVVNNAILLVVFMRSHLDQGRSVIEAATQASLERFRAIFVTTATTVAGLVPLLFETSLQAQVLVPLVASLAFGLLAATLLVLILVPALYVILDDLRVIGRKEQPSLAPV
ncbi:efflux RND transporter permease subunit [Pelagibacterium lentulum]|uniref:Acriflavin resistance protein n=1 Tax=Pelagibacterium lentulum TaxID=2029865 RepID=A0A916W1G2_9HYPH|nr:efflux RND transporter permease subunit [Pelagibacterium lentulum]GGA59530.1 acriflavin resistance protein [Pelagibacterium lentulum]